MKRWICLLLAALLLLTPVMALEQPTDEELKISAPSAILMERSTGTVLYEKNADEHLYPASVTKIMTLLLIMEQLNRILRRQLCHLLQKHRRSRKQPVCCQRVSVLLQPNDCAADLSGR